jgi:hypothetical protein
MIFKDNTVNWDTKNITIKDRDALSLVEALIEVYMSANEAQTFRDESSLPAKILYDENEQISA